MPKLYGRDWTRAEIQQYVPNLDQIAGVRPSTLRGGRADGVEAVDVTTGSGFEFTVTPGRGMDISRARYNGINLGWRSRTGEVNAAFFEPPDMGWSRGVVGGLLTTGGLTYMGSPSVDNGEALGIHGRASYIPASNVTADAAWDGDDYKMRVRGKVSEVAMMGPEVVLTREISTAMGAKSFTIRDEVENRTYIRVEHMVLYHFNFAFPILTENTRLIVNSLEVTPRDPDSVAFFDRHDRFEKPEVARPHRLYYHRVKPDADGMAHSMLLNEVGGKPLAVYLSYTEAVLPWLINWKCMQAGDYVTSMEPANAWVAGRAEERAAGRLHFLEPWEKVNYEITFGVLDGDAEIDAFIAQHGMKRP